MSFAADEIVIFMFFCNAVDIYGSCLQLLLSDLNIDEKLVVPVSTYAKATCTEAERGLKSNGIVEIEFAAEFGF